MAGLFQLLMYVCRLGVIATYMSKPFVNGFMTGAALQIITSQVNLVASRVCQLSETLHYHDQYCKLAKFGALVRFPNYRVQGLFIANCSVNIVQLQRGVLALNLP